MYGAENGPINFRKSVAFFYPVLFMLEARIFCLIFFWNQKFPGKSSNNITSLPWHWKG